MALHRTRSLTATEMSQDNEPEFDETYEEIYLNNTHNDFEYEQIVDHD